jgi:hypothetical protein
MELCPLVDVALLELGELGAALSVLLGLCVALGLCVLLGGCVLF